MKKIFKITIFFVLMVCIFYNTNYVLAAQTKGTDVSEGTEASKSESLQKPEEKTTIHELGDTDINDWDPSKQDVETDENLKYKAKIVVGIIRGIGIVVSVIALMIIGFREMTASIEEKSVIKQAMPGYILGVIMIAAITLIPTLIYEWAQKL